MAFTFDSESVLWGSIITLLINTAFVYFAARIVLDESRFIASLLTALVATFLAGIFFTALNGWWGIALAAAVWALVAAFFFRTRWVKGALIGLVAGVLWALVNLAIAALVASMK